MNSGSEEIPSMIRPTKNRIRQHGQRRPNPYRRELRLEPLEQRLPPGDMLLGGWLTKSWFGSELAAVDTRLADLGPGGSLAGAGVFGSPGSAASVADRTAGASADEGLGPS